MLKDLLESLEDCAEKDAAERYRLGDGKWKCLCGKWFDPNEEGGTLSDNPYELPSCGECCPY